MAVLLAEVDRQAALCDLSEHRLLQLPLQERRRPETNKLTLCPVVTRGELPERHAGWQTVSGL